MDNEEDKKDLLSVPLPVKVYEINGPLFFGITDQIAEITVKDHIKCVIIRMRGVPALDASAMESLNELYDVCHKKGIQFIFSHVNEQPMKVMKKAGFVKKVGEEYFVKNIHKALEKSREIIE